MGKAERPRRRERERRREERETETAAVRPEGIFNSSERYRPHKG